MTTLEFNLLCGLLEKNDLDFLEINERARFLDIYSYGVDFSELYDPMIEKVASDDEKKALQRVSRDILASDEPLKFKACPNLPQATFFEFDCNDIFYSFNFDSIKKASDRDKVKTVAHKCANIVQNLRNKALYLSGKCEDLEFFDPVEIFRKQTKKGYVIAQFLPYDYFNDSYFLCDALEGLDILEDLEKIERDGLKVGNLCLTYYDTVGREYWGDTLGTVWANPEDLQELENLIKENFDI